MTMLAASRQPSPIARRAAARRTRAPLAVRLEPALLPVPPLRMSYEQFLSDTSLDPHTERVDGDVIRMPPVHEARANEDSFFGPIVRVFVDAKALGIVLREPFQMKVAADLPGRAPDIFFVRQRNRRRIRSTFVEGPAEIVRPQSQTRDRVHTFREYEREAGPSSG